MTSARANPAIRTDFANTPQCRFHYAEAGRGPSVLLLHGGNSTWHEWESVIPLLASRFRVIAPDRPGCGQTGRPREGYGRTTQARAIVELLKAVGEERVHVVAHGLGGFLAIEMAAAMPYTVDRLALISPVTGGLDAGGRRISSDEALAETGLYSASSNHERAERIAQRYLLMPDSRKNYVEMIDAYAADSDPTLIDEIFADAGHLNDGILLRAFRSPTLIVRPEEDQTFSAERARRIAALIPLGRYVELPDVGHLAHIESAAAVARVTGEFLTGR